MLKKTALISLLLLPAFFLLHNYNELFGFMPAKLVIKHALIIYALMLAAYFIVRVLIKSSSKAALIIFTIALFVLFFGPLHSAVKIITSKNALSSYKVFLPVYCILLVWLSRKIIRSRSMPVKTILYFNIVMLCLVSAELIAMLINYAEIKKTGNLIYPHKYLCDQYLSKKIPDISKPDIYFLVFDEYTNNKTLKKLWNFNNDAISHWLETNNFYIPGNTQANYTFTPYSISSTFNMNYIEDAKKAVDATVPKNILQANKSLSDNESFCMLQKENYVIRFLAPFPNSIRESGLGHVFDYLIDGQLYRQTLPGTIDADILWNLRVRKWWLNDSADAYKALEEKSRSLHSTIEQIKATVDSTVNRRPKFVYGHLMITHGPHIFDSVGKPISEHIIPALPMFATYTTQIQYANKVMQEIVTHILSHNKPNTIIIIEGDHGFRQIHGSPPAIHFPNFTAVYFPDKDYSGLYDTMTPINLFRIIFNQYFYQNFSLLKDSSIEVKENSPL